MFRAIGLIFILLLNCAWVSPRTSSGLIASQDVLAASTDTHNVGISGNRWRGVFGRHLYLGEITLDTTKDPDISSYGRFFVKRSDSLPYFRTDTGTEYSLSGGSGQSSLPTNYTSGDLIYATTTDTLGKLAGNTSTTRKALTQVGDGTVVTVTSWDFLRVPEGGTGLTTYTSGDLIYANTTNSLSKVGGNATTTRNYLTQIGNGSVVTTTSWDTLTIPTIASGNVTVAGKVQIDTTAGDFIYRASSDTKVLTGKMDKSVVINSPVSTDRFVLWRQQQPVTIKGIHCIVDPADSSESVLLVLYQSDANGDYTNPTTNGIDGTTQITCANTPTNDDGSLSNASLPTETWLGVSVDPKGVTGTVSNLTITWDYTKDLE